jgi:hypothetical protein
MTEELMDRTMAIINACANKDEKLNQAWTGDISTVKSAEIKSIRIMRLEVDCRKREHRTEKSPASKPWSPKSVPWSIYEWNYLPEWQEMTGWDESDWVNAESFWEKCDDCGGDGRAVCGRCRGFGKHTCSTCGGDGLI